MSMVAERRWYDSAVITSSGALSGLDVVLCGLFAFNKARRNCSTVFSTFTQKNSQSLSSGKILFLQSNND